MKCRSSIATLLLLLLSCVACAHSPAPDAQWSVAVPGDRAPVLVTARSCALLMYLRTTPTRLACYSPDQGKLAWQMEVAGRYLAHSLSDDREHLVVLTTGQVVVLEAASGDALARFEPPDGTKAAFLDPSKSEVWLQVGRHLNIVDLGGDEAFRRKLPPGDLAGISQSDVHKLALVVRRRGSKQRVTAVFAEPTDEDETPKRSLWTHELEDVDALTVGAGRVLVRHNDGEGVMVLEADGAEVEHPLLKGTSSPYTVLDQRGSLLLVSARGEGLVSQLTLVGVYDLEAQSMLWLSAMADQHAAQSGRIFDSGEVAVGSAERALWFDVAGELQGELDGDAGAWTVTLPASTGLYFLHKEDGAWRLHFVPRVAEPGGPD